MAKLNLRLHFPDVILPSSANP